MTHTLAVRRAVPLAVVALATAGVVAPTYANPKPKPKPKPAPITETYDVTGLPAPVSGADPTDTSSSCVNAAFEGISITSRTIKPVGAGTLSVTLTDFTGDWDIALLNAGGDVIAQGGGTTTGDPSGLTTNGKETLVAKIKKPQELTINVCNFAGGPTATASYTFTYK